MSLEAARHDASGTGPVGVACMVSIAAGVVCRLWRVQACVAAKGAGRRLRTCRAAAVRWYESCADVEVDPVLHDAESTMWRAAELRREAAQLEAVLAEQRLHSRRQLFGRFAANGSQHLDAGELQAALQEMFESPVSLAQARRVLQCCDSDGDGLLHLQDFHEAGLLRALSGVLAKDRAEAEAAERAARRAEQERAARVRRQNLVATLPPPNHDTSWPVRLCAVAPYVPPVLEGLRLFGAAFAVAHAPAAYAAGAEWHGQLPRELWDLVPLAQPLLLFAMPTLAVRRQLPRLLRFNLNQAFILSVLLLAAYAASVCLRWLGDAAAGEEALYVPAAAQPAALPGNEAALVALAVSVMYSVACTLAGQEPAGIPVVSAEAVRSLGTSGPAAEPARQERAAIPTEAPESLNHLGLPAERGRQGSGLHRPR